MEATIFGSSKLESTNMKTIIQTSEAPTPIGPYSQAVRMGNMLFTSGQVGIDSSTGKLLTDDIETETKQVMNNLKSILTKAGFDFSHVVKTTIFMKDMELFKRMNAVYATFFNADFPARETVGVVRLPLDANVEISMIAVKG